MLFIIKEKRLVDISSMLNIFFNFWKNLMSHLI